MNIFQRIISNEYVGKLLFLLLILYSLYMIDLQKLTELNIHYILIYLDFIYFLILIAIILVRTRASRVDVSLKSVVAGMIAGGGLLFIQQFHILFYDSLTQSPYAWFFNHIQIYTYIQSFPVYVVFLTSLSLLQIGIIIAVISLGRSFSLLPAARLLKTGGLYRYMRHPIYTLFLAKFWFYVILMNLSVFNLIAGALVSGMQIYRAHLEEQILIKEFGEEYLAYKKQVKPFFFM